MTIVQLGNLHLRARRILDGLFSGSHDNPARGASQEFSAHRPYYPGDDLKFVNWKVFGRTDRLVVKQFEEETNIAGVIVLDTSASMDFSWEGRVSKIEYAKTLAAALGYLLVNQHDAVGLVAGERLVPPGSRQGHLDRVFQELEQTQASGIWDVRGLSEHLEAVVQKKSFLIVISDLMADQEDLARTLRTLHSQRHEILVLQVLDPAERDFPFSGPILFEDSETNETLRTDADLLREEYRRRMDQRIKDFSHLFFNAGIDFHSLSTDAAFDKGLGAYLSWRGARG